MTATAQDQWLAANTIKCPVGRVSKRECALLRARPTITEVVSGHGGKPGEMRFARPGACEKCPGWNHIKKEAEEPPTTSSPLHGGTTGGSPNPQKAEKIMTPEISEVKPKTKYCNACGRTLPVTDFYETLRNHSGLRPQCKDCERARTRRYAAAKKAQKAAQNDGSQDSSQSTVHGSQSTDNSQPETDNREPVLSPAYARIPTPPLRPYPEGQDEAFSKILILLRDFRAEAYEQGIKTGHRMAMEKIRSALGEEAAL